MLKRIMNFNSVLSWIMKISLLVLLFYEIYTLDFLMASGVFIALLLSLTPALINHSYNTHLPRIIDFFVTLTLYLHFLGLKMNFYHSDVAWTVWWDRFTHFLGTAVIAMLAFMVVYTLRFVGKIRLSIPMVGFFTFVTTLAIGALWEIGEFYFDYIFKAHTIVDKFDTIEDLVFDMIGGGIVSLLGMLYVGGKERRIVSVFFQPIAKIFRNKNE